MYVKLPAIATPGTPMNVSAESFVAHVDAATGAQTAHYENPKTGESFLVPYPLLTAETMSRYQEKIFEILQIPAHKKNETHSS